MSSILDRLAAAVLGGSPDRPEPDVREAGTQIPPEYPRSFAEFVGQPEAILLLRTELAGARAERRMPAHFLLYGPPGLGKTALAYVVAAEAGMSLYESSGAEFSSQAALIEAAQRVGVLWERARRPILWLIDEVDGITRVASYAIHSLMTHGWISWKGVMYGGVPITVAGPSNRMAGVPPALRSRFAEHVYIGFYDPPDLARIAEQSASRMGLPLGPDAAPWIGENAAGEPRKVNRRILRNAANIAGEFGVVGIEEAKAASRLSGLRHRGLSGPHSSTYLRFLAGYGAGRPASRRSGPSSART